MHWLTYTGLILAFIGALLSAWGGQKDGQKDKKDVIDTVTTSRDELLRQNAAQQISLDAIRSTNETLVKSNEALREQVGNYQEDLTRKQQEIERLKLNNEHTTLYKAYATYQPNGRQSLGGVSTRTDVALAMSGLLSQTDHREGGFTINIVQDPSLFQKANEVVQKYPYWAYGYYVRHFHYLMRRDRESARRDLQKLVDILTIYSKFPEHETYHDDLLEQMKVFLKNDSF